MLKILFFLFLAAVVTRADVVADKFALSVTSAAVAGNFVDFTMKIVNQSAGPVKIDISGDVAVVTAAAKGMPLAMPATTCRQGIYKPQFVVVVSEGKLIFLPSKSSRVFAPKTLAPGESTEVTSRIGIDPTALLKAAELSSSDIFANLVFQGDTSLQHSAPSPTYKISKAADDKLVLTPE